MILPRAELAERLHDRELNPGHETARHRDPIHSPLRQLNTNMDNFLDSVTSKGRRVKERFKGKKEKKDKTRTNIAEESTSSSSSFLRPVPHIAAAGHDGDGSRAGADTPQVRSGGRSPQPESVPVGGKEAEVDERLVGQSHSCPEPNVETVVGGGLGPTEVGPLDPSSSTPILHGAKPESAWTRLFRPLYLIVPSADAEPSAAPDQVPEGVGADKSAEPGPAPSEEQSNWRSTAVAAAKLLLRGVRDSADAFGPLRSVAGGLCFILENYEVRLAPWECSPTMFTSVIASEGKHTGDRVVGTSGRSARRVALQTRFRG